MKKKKLFVMLLVVMFTFTILSAQKMHIHLVEEGTGSYSLDEILSITFREEASLLTVTTMYVHLSADSIGYVTSDIEQITFSDDVSVEEMAEFVSQIPIRFLKNYPNPFNPSTTISFEVAEGGKGTVEIYNTKGQRIKTLINQMLQPGTHHIEWDGTNNSSQKVSSGVYFYRVTVEDSQKLNKMIMLK